MHSNNMPRAFFDFIPKKFNQNEREVLWKILTSYMVQGWGTRSRDFSTGRDCANSFITTQKLL